MERSKRIKALKSIDNFPGPIPHDALGDFTTTEELLATLRSFVADNDDNAKTQLKTADFIYIWDTILKYKPPTDDPARPRVKKLTGSPVEVMLQALWITLRDYKKTHPGAVIDEVAYQGMKFRHDYDSGDTAETSNSEARIALERLLGGVDNLGSRLYCPHRSDKRVKRSLSSQVYSIQICPFLILKQPNRFFNLAFRSIRR